MIVDWTEAGGASTRETFSDAFPNVTTCMPRPTDILPFTQ